MTEENGGLPYTYVIIYSPRNIDEVAVAEKLIQAAVKYTLGNAQK